MEGESCCVIAIGPRGGGRSWTLVCMPLRTPAHQNKTTFMHITCVDAVSIRDVQRIISHCMPSKACSCFLALQRAAVREIHDIVLKISHKIHDIVLKI